MTIVALKYNDRNMLGFKGIRCYADSLITSDNCNLTNQAMKILPLTIKSQPYVSLTEKIPEINIGFAFAGSLNEALLTYNSLSFFCSNIQQISAKETTLRSPPSLKDIAFLCAQVLYYYDLSYGEVYGKTSNTNILIFGYCFQEKQFKAFHIYPSIEASNFTIRIHDTDICNIDYYAIGCGKERLKKKVDKNGKFSYKLVKELIEENQQGVGGFYQRAWALEGTIRLYADCIDSPVNFSFCGFNTIFPLGKFHIVGLPMNISED